MQNKPQKKGAKAIAEAIQNFDLLPDSAHVPAAVVAVIESCSKSTVLRRSKDGTLPRPIKLGPNSTGWNVGQLRQAAARRARG